MILLRFGIKPGFAIITAIVLVAVVIYTIYAVRRQASAARHRKEPDPAIKQLNERYSRGEISKSEYEHKKKRLLNSHN